MISVERIEKRKCRGMRMQLWRCPLSWMKGEAEKDLEGEQSVKKELCLRDRKKWAF